VGADGYGGLRMCVPKGLKLGGRAGCGGWWPLVVGRVSGSGRQGWLATSRHPHCHCAWARCVLFAPASTQLAVHAARRDSCSRPALGVKTLCAPLPSRPSWQPPLTQPPAPHCPPRVAIQE